MKREPGYYTFRLKYIDQSGGLGVTYSAVFYIDSEESEKEKRQEAITDLDVYGYKNIEITHTQLYCYVD